ncbi:hypothetical protein IKF15_00935 [Candidatus Saccharibacteria bacterium]|nr:hypothetical protein [Candidatus Saccharibacteria bacterium]
MWAYYSEKELYDQIYEDIVKEGGNGNASRELIRALNPHFQPTVKLIYELYSLDNEIVDDLIVAISGEEYVEEAKIVAQFFHSKINFQNLDELINVVDDPETHEDTRRKLIQHFIEDFYGKPKRNEICYILAKMAEQEKIRLKLEARLADHDTGPKGGEEYDFNRNQVSESDR